MSREGRRRRKTMMRMMMLKKKKKKGEKSQTPQTPFLPNPNHIYFPNQTRPHIIRKCKSNETKIHRNRYGDKPIKKKKNNKKKRDRMMSKRHLLRQNTVCYGLVMQVWHPASRCDVPYAAGIPHRQVFANLPTPEESTRTADQYCHWERAARM